MARPKGVRNPDFEQKKSDLVDRLTEHALTTDLKRASLRQFAQAAGVSEPTLRHYFVDRTGVVRAIMERIAERAIPFIELASTPCDTYADSLHAYVDLSLAGVMRQGFARAHAFCLIEGVADETLGRAYLETLLEPSLAAIEDKLAPFIDPDGEQGERRRAAALCLFSPMLVSVLHQRILGGDTEAPIDIPGFFHSLATVMTHGFPQDEPAGG